MSSHLRLVWGNGYREVLADEERNRAEALTRFESEDREQERRVRAAWLLVLAMFSLAAVTVWVMR